MAWKLEVGGVDKTSSIHLDPGVEIDLLYNERGTARFTTLPGYIPALRSEVTIYDTDGTTKLFGGVIWQRESSGNYQAGMFTECECVDWTWYLDNITVPGGEITGTYTLKAVLEWIQTYLSGYGFTLDAAQVTGPSWTVTGYEWERKTVSAALRENIGPSAQGYVFFVTPAKVWGMKKADLTTADAPFTITDGSGTSTELQWRETSENYATKIIVRYGGSVDPQEAIADALVSPAIERIITADDVTNATTAQALADGYLVALNQSPRTFEIDTLTGGLLPGQVISINSTIRSVSSMKAQITRVGITLQTDTFWRYRAEATSGVYQGSALDAWRGGGGGTTAVMVGGGSISGQALTKTDDTNVTLTLGGSPTTALVNAASLTLGWTGTLSLTRGGTAKALTASAGGLVYTDADSMEVLAGTATAGQIPRSGASAAPSWSTATYPDTVTVNQILYGTSTNVIGGSANLTFNGTTLALTGARLTFSTDTAGAAGSIYFSGSSGLVARGATGTVNDFGLVNAAGTVSVLRIPTGTSNLVASNDLSVGGAFGVTGITTLTGLLNANGGIAVDTTNFTVSGTTGAVHTAGDFDVATSKFTVAAATGNTVVAGTLGITGVVTFTTNANPSLNYTSNLGALSKKYLTVHAAELWVETLVAQNTIATIGGRILVGPTTALAADLAAVDTSIVVKHNQMASGDRVYMESDGKVEWMSIDGAAAAFGDFYSYPVTRNLDGSGANAWYAGDAVFNTGTTGDGYIDLYSVSGVLSGSGPTIVGNVRTGTTYNNIAARWAIGNLNGLYSIASDIYGAAFGDPAATNLIINATSGLLIRYGTTNKLAADTSGNLSLTGSLTVSGSGTFAASNVTLDTNGIAIAVSTAYALSRSYNFTNANVAGVFGLYGVVSAHASGTADAFQKDLYIRSENVGSADDSSKIVLQSDGNWNITAVRAMVTAFAGTDSDGTSDFTGVAISAYDGTNTTVLDVRPTGVIVGSPTGNFKGVGTINAQAVYDDNVLLTDWVFDLAYHGATTARVPRDERLYSLTETLAAAMEARRLPWMPTRETFDAERNLGGLVTRLWQGQEQQQLYIFDLAARLAVLEAR